ncbi:MAG TPA: ABC transporter substrate-binding protein [Geminicoccus sp.]|jgi:iron(III) transport system substrate-binding protein|uniref:ABC transporter substrate-binding protein n=1 Tax=Geminicoccus sp. TaxID=2024832 RepID=UPI002E3201A6|nr:ABC transporter substrate-binding protein [Geminicoccus sp.]HEX2527522.1 ABC transporter substrate-binding protein [Geminicoccus sp.]
MRTWMLAGTGLAAIASGFVGSAEAAGRLTLYCATDEAWCQLMATEFEKATGIDVAMTRKSSGETFAQIKAEKDNPKGDIWWGGTGDPHLQAAEEGLTDVYESPMNGELHDWALAQYEVSGGRTVGIYAGALGFGYNTELLAQKGLAAPACWADLIKPEYKGEVQMANPNSSGTAYTALATFVQLMGEDKGFEYLKALHANINQYTKSGSAPIKAAAQGETMVGIVFQHDAVTMKAGGAPIAVVSPCEGTGYEIGSMSIIAGARNVEEAEQFYDFALKADVQTKAREAKSYQVPSNKNAPPPPESPKLTEIKLIDYDFAKYGSSAERSRLLGKWDSEVSAMPR